MTFKMYLSDFGFKMNGVDYNFPNVTEMQVEDPERNRLTRGTNATDKIGLAYKDGLKDPKRWTVTIIGMSAALKSAMDSAYDAQTRVDVYCVDRSDGSAKWAKNAVISNKPQQLTLDETAESMNVSIEFESFDTPEIHKS